MVHRPPNSEMGGGSRRVGDRYVTANANGNHEQRRVAARAERSARRAARRAGVVEEKTEE